MDCRSRAQSGPALLGHTWVPVELVSYRQPNPLAVARRLADPSRHGVRPAHELLAVVERQRRQVGKTGGRPPRHDELHGLVDLVLPLLRRPAADAAGPAEVTVEVGADLVALAPGLADVVDRRADGVVAEEGDGRRPRSAPRRVVEGALLLGHEVQAGEEQRHRRVQLLGDAAEVREQRQARAAARWPATSRSCPRSSRSRSLSRWGSYRPLRHRPAAPRRLRGPRPHRPRARPRADVVDSRRPRDEPLPASPGHGPTAPVRLRRLRLHLNTARYLENVETTLREARA